MMFHYMELQKMSTNTMLLIATICSFPVIIMSINTDDNIIKNNAFSFEFLLQQHSYNHCILKYNSLSFDCDDDYHCSQILKNMNKYDFVEKKCLSYITSYSYFGAIFETICISIAGGFIIVAILGLMTCLSLIVFNVFLSIFKHLCLIFKHLYLIFKRYLEKKQKNNYNKVNKTELDVV